MSVSSPIQRDSGVCLKHTHADTIALFRRTSVCVRGTLASVSSPIQSDSSVCVKNIHTDTGVIFGETLVCVGDSDVCVKSYSEGL